MTPTSPIDWNQLRSLADFAKCREGIVEELCRQGVKAVDRSLTLVVGDVEGGLGMLVEHWLGEKAFQALQQSGPNPLIITTEALKKGVAPDDDWRTFASNRLSSKQRLIVIGKPGPIAPKLESKLMALGWITQVVAVSRFGQLLPQQEQLALRSASKLAGAGRVLAVVLPGESATADDLAKILQRAKNQMESQGFASGRWAGAHAWFIEGFEDHHLVIKAPSSVLDISDELSNAAIDNAQRTSILAVLNDLSKEVGSRGERPLPTVSEAEQAELLAGFERSLLEIGERVESRLLHERCKSPTAQMVQQYVISFIRDWTHRNAVVNVSPTTLLSISRARDRLDYFEKLRPGASALLNSCVERAVRQVDVRVNSVGQEARAMPGCLMLHPFMIRIVSMIVTGFAFYALASFAPVGQQLAQSLALMIGGVLGFSLGGFFVRAIGRFSPESKASPTETRLPFQVVNYNAFTSAVIDALRTHLAITQTGIQAQCQKMIDAIQS